MKKANLWKDILNKNDFIEEYQIEDAEKLHNTILEIGIDYFYDEYKGDDFDNRNITAEKIIKYYKNIR